MQANKDYRLVVDAKMEDARGVPLKKDFEKRFETGKEDRQSPDYRDWQVTAPAVGTTAALILGFGESMEAALVQRMISLKTAQGGHVSGQISVHEGESVWHFRPDKPWLSGDYTLHFEAAMEDLAGNQLNRLFDEEMSKQPATEPLPEHLKRSFSIR